MGVYIMKDIREMTIDEIDNYGSEIQENIKDVSSTIEIRVTNIG